MTGKNIARRKKKESPKGISSDLITQNIPKTRASKKKVEKPAGQTVSNNNNYQQKTSEDKKEFKESFWKKIVPVIILLIVLIIFFISTRDYEKFKLLNKQGGTLDSGMQKIIDAIKECNKLTNEQYKKNCYWGISHAIGYNNFENYPEMCSKLVKTSRQYCYEGAGKRIGEEFYNNLDVVFEKCSEGKDACILNAIKHGAKLLAYHNRSFEYCETIGENHKSWCYEGITRGLIEQYYPELRVQLISNCNLLAESYRVACRTGIIEGAAIYNSKNTSYVELQNKRTVSDVQQKKVTNSSLKEAFAAHGFYAGLYHFKKQEVAFSICDNLSKDLDTSLKTICYESIFSGIGYEYYSSLI